jgi:hypothetical protein
VSSFLNAGRKYFAFPKHSIVATLAVRISKTVHIAYCIISNSLKKITRVCAVAVFQEWWILSSTAPMRLTV